MKLGLGLPQRAGTDLQHDVTRVARAAEEIGYASLWVYDRLLVPKNEKQGLHGVPGLPWPSYFRQCADPLVVLGAAAAVTHSIRLGTSIIVAPLHSPLHLAKSLATIDQISGGRLVAGLGSGWSVDEYGASGVDIDKRGELLDEAMDVLDAAWREGPVNYRGNNVVIEEAYVLPKPMSKIPVMLGGGFTKGAKKRIMTRADGWMPTGMPPKTIGDLWQQLRDGAADLGRDATAMELIVRGNLDIAGQPVGPERSPFAGSLDEIMDDIFATAESGADELIVELQLQENWYDSADQMLDVATEIWERSAEIRTS